VGVWYPALNPNGAEEAITYVVAPGSPAEMYLPPGWTEGVTVTGNALLDAAPDTSAAPYPLVILSHGFTAPKEHQYLGEHLASYGFVVLAPEHTQDDWGNMYPSHIARLQEIVTTIGFADSLNGAGGALEGLIDTEHFAVGGHSSGGMVSYGAGGAALHWQSIEDYCTEAHDDMMCADLAGQKERWFAALGPGSPQAGEWPAIWDPRVDAVFPIAGSVEMYGADGMAELKVPMLALYGSLDPWASVMQPAFELAGSSQKAQVVFENAAHSIFSGKCETTPWLVAAQLTVLCSDPVWDMDRAHDLINHFTTAFLLAQLKGDTEAAAALAPDAVQFPGITYVAQGF
jgi:predicted dienelactone hydrolase